MERNMGSFELNAAGREVRDFKGRMPIAWLRSLTLAIALAVTAGRSILREGRDFTGSEKQPTDERHCVRERADCVD